jgi:large conductance mechanosensitive channel
LQIIKPYYPDFFFLTLKPIIMAFIQDFKAFATKGNLVDVAIAFMMGGAFGKVITSFTEGLISPILGFLMGGNLTDKVAKVGDLTFKWGDFISSVINFLIVAVVCYMFIKAILRKDPNATPAPTATETLLTEIRDSLKK